MQAAKRALKNKSLSYLSALKDAKVTADLLRRARGATNMTDQIAALACLADSSSALPLPGCWCQNIEETVCNWPLTCWLVSA